MFIRSPPGLPFPLVPGFVCGAYEVLVTPSQVLARTQPTGASRRYSLLLATDTDEVRAAQRLRYRVAADELGAPPRTPEPGLDVDPFDDFCDHLVVREDATGEVVGTYRMLRPDHAELAGGLAAERVFALDGLAPLRPSLVEGGRASVHPDHRDGGVVGLVWAGIARYLLLTGNRWLAGCASVPLADGGRAARGAWDLVLARHLSLEPYRVRPIRPWDPRGGPRSRRPTLPPLLQGYLHLGAWVIGPPAHDAHDAATGCAHFFVLLGLDHLDPRYVRFFLHAPT